MEEKFTRAEVDELLKQQRTLCLNNARIKRNEYVNPYISYTIDSDTILNSKLTF